MVPMIVVISALVHIPTVTSDDRSKIAPWKSFFYHVSVSKTINTDKRFIYFTKSTAYDKLSKVFEENIVTVSYFQNCTVHYQKLNNYFLPCVNAEIEDLTVCIAINEKKLCRVVTSTLL